MTLTLEVSDVQAEARDVVSVELRARGGGPLPAFEPGAHLEVQLPNGLVRHYSLTNDCRERDRYVIGVGRDRASRGGSLFVHQSLRRGMLLPTSSPRNNFRLDPHAASHLFIAGGIGITPILAMARWCAAEGRPWRLVYAARSAQRAAFAETLRELGADRVHLHFDDERGAVLDVAPLLAGVGRGEHVYCCGPQPLMDAVRTQAASLPDGTVHFEYFTAPAEDAAAAPAGAFEVELRSTGRRYAVPADRSILAVLEDAGLSLPFSCREGLCGTCLTGVCSGEPEHRDYVLGAAERAANTQMTICVSRSKSPLLVLDL
ncbi:MAG: PDR/VanB family oxidoreductase [Betaproteobacteria bacterium]